MRFLRGLCRSVTGLEINFSSSIRFAHRRRKINLPYFLLCMMDIKRYFPSPMGEGARPADGGNGRAGEGLPVGKTRVLERAGGIGTEKADYSFVLA